MDSSPSAENWSASEVQKLNDAMKSLTAIERINHVLSWANNNNKNVVQTTSFGIHSALMLHLTTQAAHQVDNVPIIWIDTGYLPPSTYHFASSLENAYDLNLCVYQSPLTPSRMEALHGKLHENPSDMAHKKYNYIRKVEPMNRALSELNADIILTGLRKTQTAHRQQLEFAHIHNGRLKVCPVLDWTDDDVDAYFAQHELPLHPLHAEGYLTVGDAHSSAPYDPTIHKSKRDTRFGGRTQECGLHVSDSDVSLASVTPTLPEDAEDGFILYGKPSCKYCKATMSILEGLSASNNMEDVQVAYVGVGLDISKANLEELLGTKDIRTVPQIVYKGEHIGGYTELLEWHENGPEFPLKLWDKLVEQSKKFL